MKFRIKIGDGFDHLHTNIEEIPARFESEGRTIHAGRNVIKVMEINGMEVNVKRYRIPSLFNKIVYTVLRKSKGLRAFLYPSILLEKGFETPRPIAYIEERKNGLIHYSYFVSTQCPYTRNFYEFGDADINDCKDVVEAFARYTARLHENGILHHDYSPGNILFEKQEGEYHFSLIDINRMSFCKVNIKKGCANFARLWGQKAFFIHLARTYAQARGADESFCIEYLLQQRSKFWSRYRKRHELKFNLEL